MNFTAYCKHCRTELPDTTMRSIGKTFGHCEACFKAICMKYWGGYSGETPIKELKEFIELETSNLQNDCNTTIKTTPVRNLSSPTIRKPSSPSMFRPIPPSQTSRINNADAAPSYQFEQQDHHINETMNSSYYNSSFLIGMNDCDSSILKAAPLLQWLYLTNLHSSTSVETVVSFVSSITKIPEDDIYCSEITPVNRRGTKLSYCSFKLGIPSEYTSQLMDTTIWPIGIMVKLFVSKSNK